MVDWGKSIREAWEGRVGEIAAMRAADEFVGRMGGLHLYEKERSRADKRTATSRLSACVALCA